MDWGACIICVVSGFTHYFERHAHWVLIWSCIISQDWIGLIFQLLLRNTFSFYLRLCRCSHVGIVSVSLLLLLLLIGTYCWLQAAPIIVVVWLRFELLVKWNRLTFVYFVSWIILLSCIRQLRLWELISLGCNDRRRIFSLLLFLLLLLVEYENLSVLRWGVTIIILLIQIAQCQLLLLSKTLNVWRKCKWLLGRSVTWARDQRRKTKITVAILFSLKRCCSC
jgi:hypothetical protein